MVIRTGTGSPPAQPRSPSAAAETRSSTETQSERGVALPACRRDSARRLSTRPASRVPSSTTAALSSDRSWAVSESAPSACPAATTAVNGVRRSWETARSRAVLMSSDRRSAAVSTRSACMASRRWAMATSASSVGTTWVRSRCSVSGGRLAGTSSVAICSPSTPRSASAVRRRSADPGAGWPAPAAPAGTGSIAAELSPSASATRRAALPRAACVSSPSSSSWASAAARSASARRRSASSARERASSASALANNATIMNAARATQLRPSTIVNLPVGGMWKKLNAARTEQRGEQSQRDAPVGGDEQHRRQVDHAEGHHRRDLAQEVDGQGRQRHGGDRRNDAGAAPRPLAQGGGAQLRPPPAQGRAADRRRHPGGGHHAPP